MTELPPRVTGNGSEAALRNERTVTARNLVGAARLTVKLDGRNAKQSCDVTALAHKQSHHSALACLDKRVSIPTGCKTLVRAMTTSQKPPSGS